MKNKQNRKKKLAIATIVATLLLIAAGTYAFTAYTEWVKNHFQSSGMEEGKVTIVEDFTPPKDLSPGGLYKKKVTVKNTGAGKYLVRASFEEGSSRLGLTTDGAALSATNATKIVQADTSGPVSDYFPVILNSKEFKDTYLTASTDVTGLTDPQKAVVAQLGNFRVKNLSDDAAVVAANPYVVNADPDLFLFIQKTDLTKGILVRKVTVTKDDFPGEDFETNQISDVNGNPIVFTDTVTTADVYQKVGINNGNLERNTVSSVYDVKGDITYYQFNTSYTKQSSNKQGAWTTKNVFVTDTGHTGRLAAADISGAKATSKIDPQVTFNFNSTIGTAIPAAVGTIAESDKWVYNETDGYFYYLDVLNSEKSTASFLESVKFGDSDVNLLSSYNLYVGIEAIPADAEALTLAASDEIDKSKVTPVGDPQTWTFKTGNGWALDKEGTDKAVYDYYTALIAAR